VNPPLAIGIPNGGRKPWKFGKMLGKRKKIRADLSKNILNSGYFITILYQNLGKLSTVPTPYAYADSLRTGSQAEMTRNSHWSDAIIYMFPLSSIYVNC
jgi:hypothetical protein